MPSATPQSASFLVPTVDISPYLSDPSTPAARKVIETIRGACISTGFFAITNHGISPEIQKAAFEASAKFFALPFEDKCQLDSNKMKGHRGYDVLASQSYADTPPDLKESFFTGLDISPDDPRVGKSRFFMGPNNWPSKAQLSPADFRTPVEAYYTAIYDLTLKVLEMIAETLPYGPDVFKEFISNDPAAPLRLLHYPPHEVVDKRQLGAGAHTDFGAITLLLQDETPGLQVLDTLTNEWVVIPPQEGSYVVNIGDMLNMWTGGLYKSSVHRVQNGNTKDRYSIAFFFDGNLDCPLDPLDGSGGNGPPKTVEQHMIEKFVGSKGMGDQKAETKA